MKILLILFAILALSFAQTACTAEKEKVCEADLITAIKDCDKAAKQKGADQQADINCVKFLLTSKRECWPCICVIAKKQGWKIKGCDIFYQE